MSPDPDVAAGTLIEQVYAELRRLAERYVRREQAKSVQATELVHEAYLRLAKATSPAWQNRTHFVAIAAIAMRRLLVERARARDAAKRGGRQVQVTLDEGLLVGGAPDAGDAVDLIALDRALTSLEQLDPHQARIVELRYFGGLSVEETAAALDISPATVKRHWTLARAWLLRELRGGVMEAGDWARVNDLFHRALAEPPEHRAAFLEASCADRPRLREEVLSLLAAHDDAEAFLSPSDGPAAAFALGASAPRKAVHDERSSSHAEADLDRSESLAGRQLGQYRVLRTLGEGGMGVVYLADDTRLDRTVALKALASRFTQDEGRRERLRREARAAASLSDPGIATVYALEEFDNRLYLVCEYIPGETLREELERGALTIPLVLDTAMSIARALAAAHERGIVHRDLKPENIMRTPAGIVKVLDFGLAQFGDVSQPRSRLTADGMLLGTPAYMSPEQIRGQAIDGRSDLFSLGVVLYELASGEHPFAAAEAASTIAKILEAEPDRLAETIRPAQADTLTFGALDEIIHRCLRKAPEERYDSARALIRLLEQTRDASMGAGRGVSIGSPLSAPRPVAGSETHDLVEGNDVRRVLPVGPTLTPPDRPLWWWQFHQAVASAFDCALLVPVWLAHHATDGLPGLLLFLAGLVAAIVAVTLRLHLWFTVRALPAEWLRQRGQTVRWIRLADGLFVGVLVITGAMALTTRTALAVVLIGSAVAILLSSAFVEPATTRAALGSD